MPMAAGSLLVMSMLARQSLRHEFGYKEEVQGPQAGTQKIGVEQVKNRST